MPLRRIMHIDLDTFFVSVERVIHPELYGKPVVVGGNPDRRGVVATASYEARKYGLYSGMPLVTAARLCPDAIFIEGNYPVYTEYSRKFMIILANYSPFIEPVGLDEAYMDVTGFESLHGSIRQMAKSIKHRVKTELGLVASVGVASCKMVAKVASDNSKPDGLIEVDHCKEAEFLAPMPVEKLPGIGKQTLGILVKMGIYTIGQLAEMPLSEIKVNLGRNGEVLGNYARGIDKSRVHLPAGARSISREMTFAEDIREISFLESALWAESERVGAALRKKGKQARCVTVKVRFSDFSLITRRKTMRESIDIDRAIFEAGRELLESVTAKIKKPVRLVGIGVSGFLERSYQSKMFDCTDQRQDMLNIAIDKIRDRYGRKALWCGRMMTLNEASAVYNDTELIKIGKTSQR